MAVTTMSHPLYPALLALLSAMSVTGLEQVWCYRVSNPPPQIACQPGQVIVIDDVILGDDEGCFGSEYPCCPWRPNCESTDPSWDPALHHTIARECQGQESCDVIYRPKHVFVSCEAGGGHYVDYVRLHYSCSPGSGFTNETTTGAQLETQREETTSNSWFTNETTTGAQLETQREENKSSSWFPNDTMTGEHSMTREENAPILPIVVPIIVAFLTLSTVVVVVVCVRNLRIRRGKETSTFGYQRQRDEPRGLAYTTRGVFSNEAFQLPLSTWDPASGTTMPSPESSAGNPAKPLHDEDKY